MSKNYRVSIVGETKDGENITRDLGYFETLEEARELCEQLNELLRVKLHCIENDLLEWCFCISTTAGDGTYDLYAIMDSDSEELDFDL